MIRICSIILAVIGLVAALPLMVLISIAIRLGSRGPVLVRQSKYVPGRLVVVTAFRTTAESTEAMPNDARLTMVGRWLKRTQLNELPIFWNVLMGDLSYFELFR
jgi:lipopolysaccharide/colanic/teichoic acid biosynthesis glycosyltransferase